MPSPSLSQKCFMRFMNNLELKFRESDVSPGKTEVKQGKFVDFIFSAKGYFILNYLRNLTLFTCFILVNNKL